MAEKKGKIIQVIGPVVDIEFGEGHLPEILHAIKIQEQQRKESRTI